MLFIGDKKEFVEKEFGEKDFLYSFIKRKYFNNTDSNLVETFM